MFIECSFLGTLSVTCFVCGFSCQSSELDEREKKLVTRRSPFATTEAITRQCGNNRPQTPNSGIR